MPKIWGFPLTLIVALTTVLRTTVLHCDYYYSLQVGPRTDDDKRILSQGVQHDCSSRWFSAESRLRLKLSDVRNAEIPSLSGQPYNVISIIYVCSVVFDKYFIICFKLLYATLYTIQKMYSCVITEYFRFVFLLGDCKISATWVPSAPEDGRFSMLVMRSC